LSGIRARFVRAALIVAGASAALSLAGPDGLVPFKDAAAATTVGVAFVIDFGSGAPVVGCVHVPPSDNGYAALSAFTAQEHLAAPTYNQAGLLCSIGGVPASGCGQPVPGGYDYWSYWHGATGSWVYSEVGAFAAAQSRDVEGWRYENPGHANPNDTPPASAPDYASICPAVAQTAPPANPAASSPAPSSSSSASPSNGGTTSGGSAGSPPETGSAGSPGTTAPGAAPSGHSTSASGGHPTPAAQGSVTPGSSTTTTSVSTSNPATGRAEAFGPPRGLTGGQGGGGSAAPLVVGAALVAAIAAAAAWRWRRRPGAS
jgi:hypothetical protein